MLQELRGSVRNAAIACPSASSGSSAARYFTHFFIDDFCPGRAKIVDKRKKEYRSS
jgi:hypothetical protein